MKKLLLFSCNGLICFSFSQVTTSSNDPVYKGFVNPQMLRSPRLVALDEWQYQQGWYP